MIEKKRQELLQDGKTINVTDFGTAFGGSETYSRRICAIAKHSSKSEKYCRLLFRLAKYFKPGNVLELGTSFGISTMYLSAGNPDSKIITLEGCPETAAIAKDNFRAGGFQNIELVIGAFGKTMDSALAGINKIDFAFFDGNHRKTPTLAYFSKCLAKSHPGSIFVFDDICWSEEMQDTWLEIKNHPRVTATVDLFVIGIAFLNPELAKQNFIIRF